MSLRRVLGWIWAIVGRVCPLWNGLPGDSLPFCASEWEQLRPLMAGARQGGGGWRGDREPAERVIPAVNHAYIEALRQQRSKYPLQICLVDGKPLDAFLVNRLIQSSGLVGSPVLRGGLSGGFSQEPMHFIQVTSLQASLISRPGAGTPCLGG